MASSMSSMSSQGLASSVGRGGERDRPDGWNSSPLALPRCWPASPRREGEGDRPLRPLCTTRFGTAWITPLSWLPAPTPRWEDWLRYEPVARWMACVISSSAHVLGWGCPQWSSLSRRSASSSIIVRRSSISTRFFADTASASSSATLWISILRSRPHWFFAASCALHSSWRNEMTEVNCSLSPRLPVDPGGEALAGRDISGLPLPMFGAPLATRARRLIRRALHHALGGIPYFSFEHLP
mmetsp:Transcript_64058/g.202660  ORF Transcript_64058/g.202660 Transcript_64058/m.202660 type:complete len:240 (-) Transcript_64058:223-942(-)